jgi:hypothetical protein
MASRGRQEAFNLLFEGGVLYIGSEGEQDMKAVLFDFDGTLVDSDAAQIRSFNHVLTPLGRSMSEADYAGIAGWSNDAIFEALFPDSALGFRSDSASERKKLCGEPGIGRSSAQRYGDPLGRV